MLPKKPKGPKPPSLTAIVAHVCASASLNEPALIAPGKGRQAAQARALIGWLALKTKAATRTQVAARQEPVGLGCSIVKRWECEDRC